MIFSSFFGRNIDAKTTSPSVEPIGIKGPKDEETFLSNISCECAGPWILGERTIIVEQKGVATFRRDVQCEVCGGCSAFVFAAPAGAYDVAEENEGPRVHHYSFAHRVLPQLFFDDPKAFLGAFLGPSGNRRLADLWLAVGEDYAPSAIIPSSDLIVTKISFEGRNGALIRFPEPQTTPEAHFAVLLEPFEHDEARFFILEKTELPSRTGEGRARAVLCEWLEGCRRRNHDRVLPPNQSRFENAVNDQLAEERRRLLGGAQPLAPSWDVVGSQDPNDLLFAENFRLQPCLFAFHLVPKALLHEGALHPSADLKELEALIDKLWQKASQLCMAAGERPLAPEDQPKTSFHQLGAGRFLVVEMPSAFSAPEPLYLTAKATNAEFLYLLESAGARPDRAFVASIDSGGQHAILGSAGDVSLSSFLEAFSGPDDRPKVSTQSMPSVLGQLTSYVAIAKQVEGMI
jgi:hypothetical protein